MQAIQKDSELLISLMLELLNVQKDTLLYSNKGILPKARALIAQQLFSVGYGVTTIAKALDRTHSTVIQSLRKLNAILITPGYDDIRTLKKKFENSLKESPQKLVGKTMTTCVWKVSKENRLCIYCRVNNCSDRKSFL
jgi:predicted transcriptional regulator